MKKLSKLYVGLILVFLYLPILVLIIFSFNASKSKTVFSGFTLEWYQKLFQNRKYLCCYCNEVRRLRDYIRTFSGTRK